MKISDLSLVSIVTVGSPPTACMVVTLIHVPSQVILTLPAVNMGADIFGVKFNTHFKGIQALLEVLGFSVDDIILGDDQSDLDSLQKAGFHDEAWNHLKPMKPSL